VAIAKLDQLFGAVAKVGTLVDAFSLRLILLRP